MFSALPSPPWFTGEPPLLALGLSSVSDFPVLWSLDGPVLPSYGTIHEGTGNKIELVRPMAISQNCTKAAAISVTELMDARSVDQLKAMARAQWGALPRKH